MNDLNKNKLLLFKNDTKQYHNSLTIDLKQNNEVCISCCTGAFDDHWETQHASFYLRKKDVQKLIKHLQNLEKQLT